MKSVYITNVTSFLPNAPVGNEEMEDYIGLIGGKPSRVRSIVLKQNGIKNRYYGLDKEHKITHSNAQLAKEAVIGLFENKTIPTDVTLLQCKLFPICDVCTQYKLKTIRETGVFSQCSALQMDEILNKRLNSLINSYENNIL